MVENRSGYLPGLRLVVANLVLLSALPAMAQQASGPQPVVQKIDASNTKVEMTVTTSRILTMDQAIPKAQVANPDLLDFTVLSENQVQIHAKKPGITSVNLWDSKDEIHTVDVIIAGDVRELDKLLKLQFPTASVKLFPNSASTLILFGYVDRPDSVNRIMRIAEDYYPKVINNMVVGGSQQVLLHVKVMQISRTKLRNLGVDLFGFSGQNYGGSVVSGLITKANPTTSLLRGVGSFTTNSAETLQMGLLTSGNGAIAMIEALKQDDILKVLSEPTLTTVSGRPASCNVGGEVAYPQPTGFGNISVAFRPFGTQIDFVPIVLGNGSVRLEVRPRVSEVDYTLGTTINGTAVPGFRVREADTGVELQFGQTLAIAGLLSQSTEAQVKGVPYLMDVPYVGAAFRRTHNKVNEVELLIMVRPELVEALDPDQVPPCGPGMTTLSPTDCDLYFKGYREVPVRGPSMMGPGPDGSGPVIEQDGQPAPAVEEMPSAKAPTPATRSTVAVSPVAVSQAPQQPRMAATSSRRLPTPASATSPARDDRNNPANPQGAKARSQANSNSEPPGFLGPRGYDLRN